MPRRRFLDVAGISEDALAIGRRHVGDSQQLFSAVVQRLGGCLVDLLHDLTPVVAYHADAT